MSIVYSLQEGLLQGIAEGSAYYFGPQVFCQHGCGVLVGSMRMLMDGRLVALPEEERRRMRAAAAAAKSAEPDLHLQALHSGAGTSRASLSQRATTDSQPPSPRRSTAQVFAWPGPRKANSLDLPARDRPLNLQLQSRCAAVVPETRGKVPVCHLKPSST